MKRSLKATEMINPSYRFMMSTGINKRMIITSHENKKRNVTRMDKLSRLRHIDYRNYSIVRYLKRLSAFSM